MSEIAPECVSYWPANSITSFDHICHDLEHDREGLTMAKIIASMYSVDMRHLDCLSRVNVENSDSGSRI